jgi:hypothetical protein
MPKIAASKPKTMSAAGAHRPAAKMCNEASQGIHHDGSSFAENSWIPKNRNEQGTTKDPEEPAPRVGDKVEFFRIATVLYSPMVFVSKLIFLQVIIVDPNRSGYFNFRALAVVSKERYSGSGARKCKEVEVRCTEPNVLQEDIFWLPSRTLDMEIWSPSREANMRIQNQIYEEHVKNFQGKHLFWPKAQLLLLGFFMILNNC